MEVVFKTSRLYNVSSAVSSIVYTQLVLEFCEIGGNRGDLGGDYLELFHCDPPVLLLDTKPEVHSR